MEKAISLGMVNARVKVSEGLRHGGQLLKTQ